MTSPRFLLVVVTFFLLQDLVYSEKEANVQTTCAQQLHYYYEQIGLPAAYPLLQPVSFSSGIVGGFPYVDATLGFQSVARAYQANITGPPPPLPYINYISFDVPWCAFNVTVTCAGSVIYGVGKIDSCLIVDFDQGGDTQIAGRLWISVNHTGPCVNANPVVRFVNVTLDNSTTTATYTYDTLGITPPYLQLNTNTALEFYQNSTCDFSDGAPIDATTQDQFVCNDFPLVCAIPRANALGAPPVVPIPQYACLGNLTPTNMTPVMVWWISSYDLPGSISGTFFLTFCAETDQLCRINFAQKCRTSPNSMTRYTLIPGTRRQFFSPFTDFGQTIVLFYDGNAVSFQPQYTQAPNDQIVRVIPCVCKFSVDCRADGTVTNESFTISSFVTPINTPPIPIPGPAATTYQGINTFFMNASASSDPGNQPGPFSTYWKIYSQPVGSPPVSIPFPQSREFVLDTSLFVPGLYQFVLYASDSQSITYVIYNITVVYNIVTVTINISTQVEFLPYAGESPTSEATCPPFGSYPSSCIPVDGCGTTASNPAVNLSFSWTQIIGYETPIPFICDSTQVRNTAGMINDTSCKLCMIPPNIGLYGYTMSVTDGNKNYSLSVLFYVVPNFLTPQGPDLILPNYTRAPPRILTLPPRTIHTWPNFTHNITPPAPWNLPPTTPIIVPPLIPDHGPPTRDELIVFFTAIMVGFFSLLLFFAYYIIGIQSDEYSYMDRYVTDVDTY